MSLTRYISRNLLLSLLAVLVTILSCEKSADAISSRMKGVGAPPETNSEILSSSFPIPVAGTPSEFIYISDEYLALLDQTKSQPEAVAKMAAPRSPILFYQEPKAKYAMCPNLHEGGGLVDLAEFSDEIQVVGKRYHKQRVVGSVEITLGQIILSRTLSKRLYSGETMTVSWVDNLLTINGVEYAVIVDTGGGYNELGQSMATTEDTKATTRGYAFKEVEGMLSLTPLKWEDGPSGVAAGKLTALQ
jgi:hypothetical protein